MVGDASYYSDAARILTFWRDSILLRDPSLESARAHAEQLSETRLRYIEDIGKPGSHFLRAAILVHRLTLGEVPVYLAQLLKANADLLSGQRGILNIESP
jgi:hypothetical protein